MFLVSMSPFSLSFFFTSKSNIYSCFNPTVFFWVAWIFFWMFIFCTWILSHDGLWIVLYWIALNEKLIKNDFFYKGFFDLRFSADSFSATGWDSDLINHYIVTVMVCCECKGIVTITHKRGKFRKTPNRSTFSDMMMMQYCFLLSKIRYEWKNSGSVTDGQKWPLLCRFPVAY